MSYCFFFLRWMGASYFQKPTKTSLHLNKLIQAQCITYSYTHTQDTQEDSEDQQRTLLQKLFKPSSCTLET